MLSTMPPEGLPSVQLYKNAVNTGGTPYDVVLIAVESLNYHLVDITKMPNWENLAQHSIVLSNHYSTGNSTHLGVLGLLYGAPVTFYKGQESFGVPQSAFLELFKKHGYHSKRISGELTAHRLLGAYLNGFTEPVFESSDDAALIPEFRRTMSGPGHKFVFLFYYGTHFPYLHSSKYEDYVPEVRDNFDYNSWDVRKYDKQIINRYKDCLEEFDSWLGAVLREIDLSKTIVVVLGDHGEELFETGLLAHSSSLSEPMIRTPALFHLPNGKSETFKSVTSHADIMSSIVDALGWQLPPKTYGSSIFRPNGVRTAVVAQNKQTNPVDTWAVITNDCKTILSERYDGKMEITALSDRTGQNLSFRQNPSRWKMNFAEVKKLESELGSK
jgi:membrane-anchored protein YejM (alkaline phosphatase superfamily)